MGLFADLRATQKAAKQLSVGYDPAQQLRDATARMAAVTRSLEMTAPAVVTTPAQALVVECRSTGITMNDAPVVALTLLVTVDDRPPVPVSVQVPVPLLHLASLQPGQSLAVRIDPERPERVTLPWQTSVV